MNQEACIRCGQLDEQRPTAEELRQTLLESKMMSLLCHCSAEIDPSTALFYSVNHMFLGSGSYMLILFSEISPPSDDQVSGRDVYSRFYLYTLIREELLKKFDGHFTIHTAELDGRLAALLIFHYGVIPSVHDDLMQLIETRCIELSIYLKNKYDLNVVSYLGQIMNEIPLISSVYDKLLSTSTYHRYVNHIFERPVFYLPQPKTGLEIALHVSNSDYAKTISNAILSDGDYQTLTKQALHDLINEPLMSIEELKKRSGDFFETLCDALAARGLHFNHKRASEEYQIQNSSTTSWSSTEAWLLRFLDELHSKNTLDKNAQKTLLLEKAEEYIDERLKDSSLTIRDIADYLNISVATLNHLFRRQLEQTPAKYIRNLRLQEACRLLKETELPIREISDACGFGSLETFHRLFRAEYGISPGSLKRMQLTP